MTHEDIKITTTPLPGGYTVQATLRLVAEAEMTDEYASSPEGRKTVKDHCRRALVDKLYGSVRRDAENLRREIMRTTWRGPDDPIFKALQPLLDAGKHLENPV